MEIHEAEEDFVFFKGMVIGKLGHEELDESCLERIMDHVYFLGQYVGRKKEKYYQGETDMKQIPIRNMNYEDQPDMIHQPAHYHKNGIDVIGFADLQFSKEELKGFYRINCLKYITRYDRKNGVEDLKKADFYLNKLKELE